MINRHLILQDCHHHGIAITETEVREEIQRIAEKFGLTMQSYLNCCRRSGTSSRTNTVVKSFGRCLPCDDWWRTKSRLPTRNSIGHSLLNSARPSSVE